MDWNLALDLEGGPTLSFAIDAAVIVNQTSGEFYKQPVFYAMGHFSKFVQPNSKKVHVSSNHSSNIGHVAKPDKDLIKHMLHQTKLLTLDINTIIESLQATPQVVEALAFANPDDSFTIMVLNT